MPRIINRLQNNLAGALGLKSSDESEKADEILRTKALFSNQSVSLYMEEEPHVIDWIRECIPTITQILQFFNSLFPFTSWISSYNSTWFFGDLIAGVTIGAVVVPQGMAYAVLAGLPPQYGLYSSFVGVLIYWLFATSKDITIGPIAVMSVFVGNIVSETKLSNPEIPAPVIASAFTLTCGIIISFIGLFRCGWIIVLIPLISIAAFSTGSAITITIGQIPGLMGIGGLDNRGSPYELLIQTIKNLSRTKLDAALGLSALFFLYFVRSVCTFASKKFPSYEKRIFFVSTLRTVIIILLYTLISWIVNRNHRNKPLFKIISTIPSGFTAANVPVINISLISLFANHVPTAVIIILIEHIAIAKSFGRINNYVINPSQEMLAIGMTNVFGPFLGGFTATGSFSRTAIKSKAGVRTPIAGVITATIVLLAIFALPSVFFYIPSSALSAVIIHSVLDLITPPRTVYQFWRISPLEVPIFFTGVVMTIFTSIENGIYITIGASMLLFILRFIKAKGNFLGKVKSYIIQSDSFVSDEIKKDFHLENGSINIPYTISNEISAQHIFPPLDRSDGINPQIKIQPPRPGIFVYRFRESFNYLNADHYLDQFASHILANTRRTNQDFYSRPGDRPWNDPSPRKISNEHLERPTLKAVIFDFSAVNYVDVTSMQQLIDIRKQFDRYASPDVVDWHFCNINNRWTKRALVAAGFGYPSIPATALQNWKSTFSAAKIDYVASATKNLSEISKDSRPENRSGIENTENSQTNSCPCLAMITGLNRPLFHADLMSAWQNAILNLAREQNQVSSCEC